MGPPALNISSSEPVEDAQQNLLPSKPPPLPEDSLLEVQSQRRANWARFSFAFGVAACIFACVAAVFVLFSCRHRNQADFYSDPEYTQRWGFSRPLKTLSRPVVLLISSDGFRYGYHWKVPLPNIHRLQVNGTEAVPGMIPVYPTLTFPNHYSIATGLYPAWHGIIANYFSDPSSNERFHPGIIDPKWWLGEPIWESIVKHGLISATYFWPGSDVSKGAWNCNLPYCQHYNHSVPYEDRVDTVLAYFDLPDDKRPSLITLYFEEPDHTGHMVGADDPHIDKAIVRVDQMLGRLFDGLDARNVFDDVSIILLSDHGMVGTCDKKIIYLEDFAPWISMPSSWTDTLSPVLAVRPPPNVDVKEVYQNITEALSSGKVANSEFLQVYLKEDFPSRLHYSSSDRIPPIIGIVAEGYKLERKRSPAKECAGAHGYDNEASSMHPIFIAHGPQFAKGRQIASFVNVEVYNLIASILGIQGAANNGTLSFSRTVLLPSI
ncbi:hypothetical protein GOP47_0008250 [Adiantum capillus-veneris]|uniref:Uncharacterized protein n=1 Tax=Adiantum capillus-veneris TaxID=13818 RepID=A0A9D4UXX1_ADICA|nr:hypothetical protein GOP47_0008250 [Adiantum capillus-veneris]